MTELEKFLTSLYDAVLQAEVTAQSHGQAAYTLLQASPSPSQRDSRIPVYHATNISIDLDVGLEAREENGVTRMYVTDRPEDETAISFDLEVYDFIEPSDQPDLGDLPIEGGDGGGGGEGSGGGGGGFPFARPDIGFVSDPPWNVNEEVLRTRLLEQAGEDVGESARESTDEGSEGGGRGDESEDGGQGDERTRDDGGDEADGGSPGDGGDGEDGGSEDDGGVGGSADSESDGSGDSGEATEAGDDGSGGGSEGGDDGSGGGSEGSEGGNESGDGPFDDLPEFDNPVIDPRDRIREFTGDNDEVTNDE